MPDEPNRLQTSTTDAVAQQAQSAPEPSVPAETAPEAASPRGRRWQRHGLDERYHLGPAITRAFGRQKTESGDAPADPPGDGDRRHGAPIYRPLRIFTLDPSSSRLEGATALVNVPYEKLKHGPEGKLFKIREDPDEEQSREALQKLTNLDLPEVLLRNGYDPSPSNFHFHRQMVYAVCSNVYATFRAALGRDLEWGSGDNAADGKLVILPHHLKGRNACYDARSHQLHFGCAHAASNTVGRTLPGSMVYACLSHDIIAHELSHALLHGLRRHYLEPCGPDTLAFHEAFADLVAIFQHFSYREVVLAALRKSRGTLEQAELLTSLARQFGHMEGSGNAIRSAIDVRSEDETPTVYNEYLEPHQLGSVLVSAVFEAFITVYKRKTARYIRLATNGTGVLPKEGELPLELQAVLAEKASRLASQFLSICIRAIDYCPPVNLGFGEYLQALITADYNLVPDDPWAYREALIDAFRRRQIHPHGVLSYAEEDLLWAAPSVDIEPEIRKLSFAHLRFEGDPGQPFPARELERRACILGDFVTRSQRHLDAFGLVSPDKALENGDWVDLPYVESLRSARRIGPSGQIVFDVVAEIVQKRSVCGGNGREAFDFHGGCTVILGPRGELRYVIAKSADGPDRLTRRLDFLRSDRSRRYWQPTRCPPRQGEGFKLVPRENLFQLLDGVEPPPAAAAGQATG